MVPNRNNTGGRKCGFVHGSTAHGAAEDIRNYLVQTPLPTYPYLQTYKLGPREEKHHILSFRRRTKSIFKGYPSHVLYWRDEEIEAQQC